MKDTRSQSGQCTWSKVGVLTTPLRRSVQVLHGVELVNKGKVYITSYVASSYGVKLITPSNH